MEVFFCDFTIFLQGVFQHITDMDLTIKRDVNTWKANKNDISCLYPMSVGLKWHKSEKMHKISFHQTKKKKKRQIKKQLNSHPSCT